MSGNEGRKRGRKPVGREVEQEEENIEVTRREMLSRLVLDYEAYDSGVAKTGGFNSMKEE